jgi:hypothetical protein
MRPFLTFACLAVAVLPACGASVVDPGGAGGTASTTTTTGTTTADPTLCAADWDCAYRATGCCGMCAAVSAELPPPISCGAPCAAPSACACVDGHCATAVPNGSACDPGHDACEPNTKCCPTCCGPDGGAPGDPMNKCVLALGDVCPTW